MFIMIKWSFATVSPHSSASATTITGTDDKTKNHEDMYMYLV